MKAQIQIIAISLVFASCGTLNQGNQGKIGSYDEAYYTPDDEEATPEPPAKSPNGQNAKAPTVTDNEYQKYKETPSNRPVDNSNYNNQNGNTGTDNWTDVQSSDNYYYDDDDDFSYGRSLRRLRYGDGYRDGYNDALANSYSFNNNYYYSNIYGDPYWGWSRTPGTRFWVGYNTWGNWSVGYNYSYPSWGWRTSCYPVYYNFYDPWYGYNCNGFGYYTNVYYGGAPYGFYSPYYGGYYGGYYGNYYNNWGYHNYWQRPVYVHQNNNPGAGGTPKRGTMYGPRETIGSNNPQKGRDDQVSPRSRGGYVQPNDNNGGQTYDPSKDNSNGVVQRRNNWTPVNASGSNGRGSDNTGGNNTQNGTNDNRGNGNQGNTGNTTGSTGNTGNTDNRGRNNAPASSDNGGRTTTPQGGNTRSDNSNPGNTGTTSRDYNNRNYQYDNGGRTSDNSSQTRSRGNNEPTQSKSRGSDQPSGNTYQRQHTPSNNSSGNSSGRSYSPPSGGGGGGGGGGSTGGSTGGSPSSRGRSR